MNKSLKGGTDEVFRKTSTTRMKVDVDCLRIPVPHDVFSNFMLTWHEKLRRSRFRQEKSN